MIDLHIHSNDLVTTSGLGVSDVSGKDKTNQYIYHKSRKIGDDLLRGTEGNHL
jgi:hypothetical protein